MIENLDQSKLLAFVVFELRLLSASCCPPVPALQLKVRPPMQDSQHMLPGEFVAVVAFLFAPPLLLSFMVQTMIFAVRGIFARGLLGRAVAGYVTTLVGSLAVGFAVHLLAPSFLGPTLRVRDLIVGSQSWPVMPLAFLAVAIAASFSTFWVMRNASPGT